MRGGSGLLAVLTLGGAVSAAGGAVIIDMPAPPAAARSGIESPEPSESAPAPKLGDVALKRYAGARHEPSYTPMASPGWWGWPYGRFGYGYGVFPSFGWGWPGWGWHGLGYPHRGFSPYHGCYRFRHPYSGSRWRGSRFPHFTGRRRWR